MGWCWKCGHSAMETQRCYNRRTMQVLVKYTCLICKHVEYGLDFTTDTNECEHPILMTWKQWLERCRQGNYHYMALDLVGSIG